MTTDAQLDVPPKDDPTLILFKELFKQINKDIVFVDVTPDKDDT